MGVGLNVFLIISSIITSVVMAFLLITIFHKDDDDHILNNPIVWNYSSIHAQGYACGVERSAIVGKGGRIVITFSPFDIHPDKIGKVDDIKFVVGKGKRLVSSVNDLSSERPIVRYLPPQAGDFTDAFKKTVEGRTLMMLTEEINASNAEILSLKEGSERKTAILGRLGGGELSETEITRMLEIHKDAIKSFTGKKEDKPGFSPIQK